MGNHLFLGKTEKNPSKSRVSLLCLEPDVVKDAELLVDLEFGSGGESVGNQGSFVRNGTSNNVLILVKHKEITSYS